jgi:outer membrane lipoprotein-sorting protein
MRPSGRLSNNQQHRAGLRFVLLLLLGILPNLAHAALDAEQIIDDMEKLYRGERSKAEITMMIETPQYQRTMQMTSRAIGEEQSFIRILTPKKDRGIATLKLDNEMWNYFPKINKVIKVPPSMMMGSWMGSDFTNDDLVKQTTLTEEYNLSLNSTDDEHVITLTPKEQTVTVWGKIDYVVDRQLMVPKAQRFYDDRGELIRTLAFSEPKDFGEHTLPSKLEMIPHNKTGHRTVIVYDSLEFDPEDVTPDQFTLRHLRSRF